MRYIATLLAAGALVSCGEAPSEEAPTAPAAVCDELEPGSNEVEGSECGEYEEEVLEDAAEPNNGEDFPEPVGTPVAADQ